MWSESCRVLNPYEALFESSNDGIEDNKISLRMIAANALRRLSNSIDN